jgi:hypothetical protein
MGIFGNILGGALGQAGGQYFGGDQGRQVGGTIGGALGGLLPFKKGGRVKAPKGKPVPALVHGGEYVLPVGVKPTKTQMAAVAKLHRKK